jgi:hypothetical protein
MLLPSAPKLSLLPQSGILSGVEASFIEHGGLIWIRLEPEWVGFTEALNDGVSALSPRGVAPAVSTYWIDHALAGVENPPGAEVASGNSTRIIRTATGVRAESDYEVFDGEDMPVEDFRALLEAWREKVVAQIGHSDPARPEQGPYQRNPHA